ncbi:TetR family transcriptional regulator [Ralstonia solanacearum]|nr:TetR family transcriptional regulator [Ralstonia solanacearum]AXV89680.1 TetR family transcriptional regulator [Ralstonia solanacearum]AXW74593.1 TetR family transcriptional regulator [Ralstonia solanacearum]BEU70646.1 TetR/AcrR family transcriptional regulator [Ralstonia pseudosolanacearum]
MSRGRSLANPRKIPVQERSRATVDAIIQASTYILTKVGWEGLTTNAIAQRAGVNIGSLYQYFPNKEAVVAELQRRHIAATRADLHEALLHLREQRTLRKAITLIVEVIVKEHRIAPAVHKAVTEELPLTVRCMPDGEDWMRHQLREALQPFMKNVPDPELAIYMVSVAAHGIIHDVTARRPELLDDPGLVTELVTLFERYLLRPAGSGSKRKPERS